MKPPPLTVRQRLTFVAHLYKAIAKQHHRELRPLFARHVGAGAVVIDAGAHVGQFAKLFASLARGGRVYAFEPGDYARRILERVVRWRRLGNVAVVPLALSDTEGRAELAVPIKPSGSFGFGLGHLASAPGEPMERREWVRVTTLDRFVAETGLGRLDFIKADIEGGEVRLLRGGMTSIARLRPAIMLELVASHLRRAGGEAREAWDLLTPLGYTAYPLGRDGTAAATFDGDADYLFVSGASADLGA